MKLDDEEWQARLIEVGLRLRPRLFVFDPLARMKAAELNESAQNEISVAIEFMRTLRDETNAAVLFVQHTGHTGEHMRGSSDLETAWETRLRWKLDGQSREVTIESEHREAEPTAPFKYRIASDGLTRSMRFEAVEDDLTAGVREYLAEHPNASGNEVFKALGGNRAKVLALVKDHSSRVVPTAEYHPGTTPYEQRQGSGTPNPRFRGLGTTLTGAHLEVVPTAGTTVVFGDDFLPWLYERLERGLITEAEWHEADRAHRFVVAGRSSR